MSTNYPPLTSLVSPPLPSMERELRWDPGCSHRATQAAIDAFVAPPSTLTDTDSDQARYLTLDLGPLSDAAKALCASVLNKLSIWENGQASRARKRRAHAAGCLTASVGNLVGGLLLAWSAKPPKAVYFTVNSNCFTGQPIGSRPFQDAVKLLLGAGLVHRRDAIVRTTAARTARYWPTSDLLQLAIAHGVHQQNVASHFGKCRDAPLLRATGKPRGTVQLRRLFDRPGIASVLRIDPTNIQAFLAGQDVNDHRAFLARFTLTGCEPPVWTRVFQGNFRLHGRWYDQHPASYQTMSEEQRVNSIFIDGEAVAEVDIRSCFLTILHARQGLLLPEGDLYGDCDAVPREVRKVWVNATIGKAGPVTKWAKKTLKEYPSVAAYDPRAVGEAMLALYPFLADPAKALGLHDTGYEVGRGKGQAPAHKLVSLRLMALEADVITAAMRMLRKQNILALPMHDGLIVPASAAVACQAKLSEAGKDLLGTEFRFSATRAPSHRFAG